MSVVHIDRLEASECQAAFTKGPTLLVSLLCITGSYGTMLDCRATRLLCLAAASFIAGRDLNWGTLPMTVMLCSPTTGLPCFYTYRGRLWNVRTAGLDSSLELLFLPPSC